MTRQPYQAGRFYEGEATSCRRSASTILSGIEPPKDLSKTVFGGLVPHAGWPFSGRTAALTLKALAQRGRLKQVVVFGADHWGIADGAAAYASGAWGTPLGEVPVDEELARALLESCPRLRTDPDAHRREHSIEVQLPLMQLLCPEVRVVPVNVSPSDAAVEVGHQIGQALKRDFPAASVVGSTDLTHYGPDYGFTPGGLGPGGLEWARQNDRRILKLIESMQADRIVEEAGSRQNACGGGAVAAAIAACTELGATQGRCLEYTTSARVMEALYQGRSDDAVGYAAVVFV